MIHRLHHISVRSAFNDYIILYDNIYTSCCISIKHQIIPILHIINTHKFDFSKPHDTIEKLSHIKEYVSGTSIMYNQTTIKTQ